LQQDLALLLLKRREAFSGEGKRKKRKGSR
jgi:hypothetical protein